MNNFIFTLLNTEYLTTTVIELFKDLLFYDILGFILNILLVIFQKLSEIDGHRILGKIFLLAISVTGLAWSLFNIWLILMILLYPAAYAATCIKDILILKYNLSNSYLLNLGLLLIVAYLWGKIITKVINIIGENTSRQGN